MHICNTYREKEQDWDLGKLKVTEICIFDEQFPNQAWGHSYEAFSLLRAWRPRALIKLSHQLLCSSYGRKEEEAWTPLLVANCSQSVPRITAESDTEFYPFLVQTKIMKPK